MAVVGKLLVILGPTASGKSDLAVALAQAAGAEILSVDSMQVYRGMDIGTAKPGPADQAAVRHHLIDLVEPSEPFTVARYVAAADAVIVDAAGRGVPLIATGGTPLYFKSLFEGLFEGPGADPEIRARLGALGADGLAARLRAVDPAAADRIHGNDIRRMVRALEVYELTGKRISSLQTEWAAAQPRHAATWVGLHWDREILNRRINARFKAMLAAGWLEETRALLARYGDFSLTAGEATGYQELIEHLQGKTTLEEAGEQIKIATRQLARRQMKWFRRFANVKWIAGEKPLEELTREVMDYWMKDGAAI
ncbi:MAG TPA: tRNA (adenosine(37)-N6)-dimethylallyltransferase MiaA [Tepidisphaeraceae bacterium]|jgi:tRNA dimethylallyltransferase|nr:tRNA (adenosine(37)-N6)-dimethylallyltransferase MiaA [Tepidisphaeraceae bacterium]